MTNNPNTKTVVTDPIVTHLAQEILRSTTAGTQTYRLACLLLEHQQHLARIDEVVNGKPGQEKQPQPVRGASNKASAPAPASEAPAPEAPAPEAPTSEVPAQDAKPKKVLRPRNLAPDLITGPEIMAELNTTRRVMSRIGTKGFLKKTGTYAGGGIYTRQSYLENLENIRYIVKLDEVEQSGQGINKGYGGSGGGTTP
jgi:hypothetical protein